MERLVELERYLGRAPCPDCGRADLLPAEVSPDGTHLGFRCLECDLFVRAELPQIKKKLVYLDTSILSNIARDLLRGDTASPWVHLHEKLREAVAANVICCPVSPIAADEFALAGRLAKDIQNIALGLGSVSLHGYWDVLRTQLHRAARRYLETQPPLHEAQPSEDDVFDDDPHAWVPTIGIHAVHKASDEELAARRAMKQEIPGGVTPIFARYATDGLSFEQVRLRERQGVANEMFREVEEDLRYLNETGLPPELGILTPEFLALKGAFEAAGSDGPEALRQAMEFMRSEHAMMIPVVDITSRLHAAAAGKHKRSVSQGDHYDIQHIATYLPYVDVLVADTFFADLCNVPHTGLAGHYRAEARKLGPTDVPAFIDWVDGLMKNAPFADLTQRVYQALEERGDTARLIAGLQEHH